MVPKKDGIILLPFLGLQSNQISKRLKSCIYQFYSCFNLKIIFQNTCRIKSFFQYKARTALIALKDPKSFTKGAIHSTKISGNFGPKLNVSARSSRKSFEKTGPPFEVVLFSRSDRSEFWLNGSRLKLFVGIVMIFTLVN